MTTILVLVLPGTAFVDIGSEPDFDWYISASHVPNTWPFRNKIRN